MKTLLILTALAGITGCALHSIQTPEIKDSVGFVTARRDAYVRADPTLTEADKAGLLAVSEVLRQRVATGETVKVDTIGPMILQVCDEHDRYVRADTSIDPKDRDFYLLGTSGLRIVVQRAGK